MPPPDEVHQQFQAALAVHQRGSIPHARTLYEKILERHPGHFDTCHLLGVTHIQTGSPERGAELISQALRINPESADAHYNLGHALRSLGRLDEALSCLDRAVGLKPSSAKFNVARGLVLQELNRLPQALLCFEQAVTLDPASADAHYRKAIALAKLNRLNGALASCEEAIRLAPRTDDFLRLKTMLLSRRERIEQTLEDYDASLESNSRFGQRTNHLDSMLEALEETITTCRKAIELQPADAGPHIELAATLNRLGRHDEAVACCDAAVALEPVSAAAYAQRGYALGRLYRPREALECFNTALQIDHAFKPARSARASLHARCERWELARLDYEAALRQDPQNEFIWKGLALLPEGCLQPDCVSDLLERLGEPTEGPGKASRLFLKAQLLLHLRRHHDGFECLRHANRLRQEQLAHLKQWRRQYASLHRSAAEWKPRSSKPITTESGPRLLVILGPSRSGKTTLETLLCRSTGIARGFEGGNADKATRSLSDIQKSEGSSPELSRPETLKAVLDSLFFAGTDDILANEPEAITVTNPFLLPAVQLIHDLHPGAFFVFVRRNTIDNAADVFARDYRYKHPFAYSAPDTVDYVELYQSVCDVLLQKMGSRALRISYDDVIGSPAHVLTVIRQMLGLAPPEPYEAVKEERESASVYREMFASQLAGQGVS